MKAKSQEIRFVISFLQKCIIWSEVTKSYNNDKAPHHMVFSIVKGDIQELKE